MKKIAFLKLFFMTLVCATHAHSQSVPTVKLEEATVTALKNSLTRTNFSTFTQNFIKKINASTTYHYADALTGEPEDVANLFIAISEPFSQLLISEAAAKDIQNKVIKAVFHDILVPNNSTGGSGTPFTLASGQQAEAVNTRAQEFLKKVYAKKDHLLSAQSTPPTTPNFSNDYDVYEWLLKFIEYSGAIPNDSIKGLDDVYLHRQIEKNPTVTVSESLRGAYKNFVGSQPPLTDDEATVALNRAKYFPEKAKKFLSDFFGSISAEQISENTKTLLKEIRPFFQLTDEVVATMLMYYIQTQRLYQNLWSGQVAPQDAETYAKGYAALRKWQDDVLDQMYAGSPIENRLTARKLLTEKWQSLVSKLTNTGPLKKFFDLVLTASEYEVLSIKAHAIATEYINDEQQKFFAQSIISKCQNFPGDFSTRANAFTLLIYLQELDSLFQLKATENAPALKRLKDLQVRIVAQPFLLAPPYKLLPESVNLLKERLVTANLLDKIVSDKLNGELKAFVSSLDSTKEIVFADTTGTISASKLNIASFFLIFSRALYTDGKDPAVEDLKTRVLMDLMLVQTISVYSEDLEFSSLDSQPGGAFLSVKKGREDSYVNKAVTLMQNIRDAYNTMRGEGDLKAKHIIQMLRGINLIRLDETMTQRLKAEIEKLFPIANREVPTPTNHLSQEAIDEIKEKYSLIKMLWLHLPEFQTFFEKINLDKLVSSLSKDQRYSFPQKAETVSVTTLIQSAVPSISALGLSLLDSTQDIINRQEIVNTIIYASFAHDGVVDVNPPTSDKKFKIRRGQNNNFLKRCKDLWSESELPGIQLSIIIRGSLFAMFAKTIEMSDEVSQNIISITQDKPLSTVAEEGDATPQPPLASGNVTKEQFEFKGQMKEAVFEPTAADGKPENDLMLKAFKANPDYKAANAQIDTAILEQLKTVIRFYSKTAKIVFNDQAGKEQNAMTILINSAKANAPNIYGQFRMSWVTTKIPVSNTNKYKKPDGTEVTTDTVPKAAERCVYKLAEAKVAKPDGTLIPLDSLFKDEADYMSVYSEVRTDQDVGGTVGTKQVYCGAIVSRHRE